jgi:hypothetical protein
MLILKKKNKMPRDHFSKMFFSPYFQTDYYKNETPGGKIEQKINYLYNKLKDKMFKNRRNS